MRIPQELIYSWKNIDFTKEWDEIEQEIDKNWKELTRIDKEAKKRGLMVGRYITHPIADGRATYQIIYEAKDTIKIRVVGGIGDDWVLPAWGVKTEIDKEYALKEFKFRDFWEKKNEH